MSTTTVSPVERRRELQRAANEYVHGKLTSEQYEERVRKYGLNYRTEARTPAIRGSVRHSIKRALGLTH